MKVVRLALIATLLVSLTLFAAPVRAQEEGAFALGETSVVIPAEGEETVSFQTFCLDFGLDFPTTLGRPDGRATDDVLRVIKSAIERDVADDEPLAVQLAIWSLREGSELESLFPDTELDAASEARALLDADVTVSPLADDRGIPLDRAVADGIVEATSDDFAFVDAEQPRPDGEPYHGRGTLTIRNLTDQEVEIYFPFGTIFRAENENEQDIVAYATELEQVVTPESLPETGSATDSIARALIVLGGALLAVGWLAQRRAPVHS